MQYDLQMFKVLRLGLAKDDGVIKITNTEWEIMKAMLHEALKSCRGVVECKQKNVELAKAILLYGLWRRGLSPPTNNPT